MATPGIDINRGRIVHLASRVRSICESVFEETPIFISRLVDDSGERITGLFAAAGSREASTASRSCTTCRAAIRSVPSLRIRTTDESPSTDFDRIVLSPIVPLSAFSSGTLIRLSTSSVESPGASVWISIRGGANSGKTSRGAFLARWMPTIISTIDSASTSIRSRSDVETIQFIMAVGLGRLSVVRWSDCRCSSVTCTVTRTTYFLPTELGPIELGGGLGDDLGAGLEPAGQRGEVADDAVDEDAAAGVDVGRDVLIDPGAAQGVADQGRAGDGQALLVPLEREGDADALAGAEGAVLVVDLVEEVDGGRQRVAGGGRGRRAGQGAPSRRAGPPGCRRPPACPAPAAPGRRRTPAP